MKTPDDLDAHIQEVHWAVSRWREATAQVARVRPEVDAAIYRAVAAGRALRRRGVQSRIERETGLAHATVYAASRETDEHPLEPLSDVQRTLLTLALHHPASHLNTVGQLASAATLSQARDISHLIVTLMRTHSVSPADISFLNQYVDLLPGAREDIIVRHVYLALLAETLSIRDEGVAWRLLSAVNSQAKLDLALPTSYLSLDYRLPSSKRN